MVKKDPQELKFEEAIADLEQVVEQLESGDLSLEDSLAAFGWAPGRRVHSIQTLRHPVECASFRSI
jgi:hypothetical protein